MTFHRTLLCAAIASGCILLVGADFASAHAYDVQTMIGAAKEYHCLCAGHHFLSIIDDHGAFVLRTHPEADPNAWGSSLYVQPFLPGAVLGHTTIKSVAASTRGIEVSATGSVSRGKDGSYGTWSGRFSFQFDAVRKQVSGTGEYSIDLDGPLSPVGDLNVLKIASNYLQDVPLLSGGTGDTGDMRQAVVTGGGLNLTWNPRAQPAFFPETQTCSLSMTVEGQCNIIDTAAQGYRPIASACKPSLQVTLASKQSGIPMIFGAVYDVSKAKQFWEDNIGITPLVLRSSPSTHYGFEIALSSHSVASDESTDSTCNPDCPRCSTVASESCRGGPFTQRYAHCRAGR